MYTGLRQTADVLKCVYSTCFLFRQFSNIYTDDGIKKKKVCSIDAKKGLQLGEAVKYHCYSDSRLALSWIWSCPQKLEALCQQ